MKENDMRWLAPALAALYGVAYVYSATLKGSAGDNYVLWSVRHSIVAAELFLDPPPPQNAPMSQGAAWLFSHAGAAATLLADPPRTR
jgi:hypothetical protein